MADFLGGVLSQSDLLNSDNSEVSDEVELKKKKQRKVPTFSSLTDLYFSRNCIYSEKTSFMALKGVLIEVSLKD